MTLDEAGAQAKRSPTRRRSAFERPDEDDRKWRTRGACIEYDPELWFSPLPAMRVEAISICGGCPVRAACLSWARKTDQRFGIWGSVDFEAAATSTVAVDEMTALAATVARLPLVDRVRRLLEEFPGSTLAEVANRFGYKNAGSLERTLYRRGDDGKALIRELKSGGRPREQAEVALSVDEAGTDVQHRKNGKPGRKTESPTPTTESEEDAA